MKTIFSKEDIKQIQSIGLTESRICDQIDLFKKGTPYLKIVRPCTVGDGIIRFSPETLKKNIEIFDKEGGKRQLIKFVPASGAATRMVKTLIKANNSFSHIRKTDFASDLFANKKENEELLTFVTNLHRFACYPDLEAMMAANGLDANEAQARGEYKDFIDFLVTSKGLNYAGLPKGLIKFHAYPEGSRTAFEEHLVEAAEYGVTNDRSSRLHFTVSEMHEDPFKQLFQTVRDQYESKYHVKFHISFSIQKTDTNTIAVDMDNQPFRTKDGRLLFRPGGHGALISNLNGLKGDVIFIKNIDNVAHDRVKAEMIAWKKALAGHMISLQQQIFSYLTRLHQEPIERETINSVASFVQNELLQSLPKDFRSFDTSHQKKELIQRLDRPLRVCGMVLNAGEPGGGPFWVEGGDGQVSMQIVETSQINLDDKNQKSVLNALTHFNPVDLVCGTRNWKGDSFDLLKYVDPGAVFITQKSEGGKDLKALELPGLWNGAMAYWNTVFVEVPLITFNPVKQIADLLRDAHLP